MNSRLFPELLACRDEERAKTLARFFRTGPGEYGEGDVFLGIPVPVTRRIVRAYGDGCSFAELDAGMASEYHEFRLASLLTLIRHFQRNPAEQEACVRFYLEHIGRINNWDLVDLSCYELLGSWLLERDRSILYRFARDRSSIWRPRIGIVSTMQFIRHGGFADTLAIAELLIPHPHDLIHKASGWLLREVGKRDKSLLTAFLELHWHEMPRTMLRYAIERFPEPERRDWLLRKKKSVPNGAGTE